MCAGRIDADRHALFTGSGMKYVGFFVCLSIGVGLGWVGRGWVDDSRSERADADRTASRPPAPPPVDTGGAGAAPPARMHEDPPRTETPDPAAAPAPPEGADAEEGGTDAADVDMDSIAEMFRSQSPQWKAFAKMQIKQRLGPLLKELGYDHATATMIEEAFLADAERSIDRLIAMMLGEEEFDDSLANWMMGLPPKMSPELERDLATFLGDNELSRVRTEMKKTHDKQMEDFVELQINMMGIAGLTEQQRREVQDLVRGNDPMREQFRQFAEVTRDKQKFARLMAGEGLAEEMEKQMAPRRERMRQILTPQQFEQYRTYEQTLVKQAEMGMKMFQAMAKQTPKPEAPSGK